MAKENTMSNDDGLPNTIKEYAEFFAVELIKGAYQKCGFDMAKLPVATCQVLLFLSESLEEVDISGPPSDDKPALMARRALEGNYSLVRGSVTEEQLELAVVETTLEIIEVELDIQQEPIRDDDDDMKWRLN